jgi:hypothetical protein
LLQVLAFTAFVLGFDWLVFEKTAFAWPLQFGLALLAGLVGLLVFGLFDVRAARRGWLQRYDL